MRSDVLVLLTAVGIVRGAEDCPPHDVAQVLISRLNVARPDASGLSSRPYRASHPASA